MERPSIPQHSPERMFLTITGYIFTTIFTIEMTLKVIANSCFLGQGAYFKDGWNILDGILVIISLINVIMEFFVSGGNFLYFFFYIFINKKIFKILIFLN